jgi:hypothetical protein
VCSTEERVSCGTRCWLKSLIDCTEGIEDRRQLAVMHFDKGLLHHAECKAVTFSLAPRSFALRTPVVGFLCCICRNIDYVGLLMESSACASRCCATPDREFAGDRKTFGSGAVPQDVGLCDMAQETRESLICRVRCLAIHRLPLGRNFLRRQTIPGFLLLWPPFLLRT